jgi:transcriptional regulator with PAS, ATPase and Fis domain
MVSVKDNKNNRKWAFVAASGGRRSALDLAKKISTSNCSALILGPTGVGKEVLAEDIHAHSPRAEGRFIAVNCAALTPTLFESELFGHQRGAYTGAFTRKVGLVELADRGTLFLDEIGELSLDIQAKLLRFLARGTFWPLGSTEERAADVRVIAATNRNLRAMVPSLFREDLMYRLSVVPILLPPLEPDDTRVICMELAGDVAEDLGYTTSHREINTLSSLSARSSWPGGARELRSALQRYFILRERKRTIEQNWQVSYKFGSVQFFHPTTGTPKERFLGDADEMLRRFEEVVFLELAREAKGVRDLSQRLDRTPQAVYDRLKKLGVSPDDRRGDKLNTLLFEARGALAPYKEWIQALLTS